MRPSDVPPGTPLLWAAVLVLAPAAVPVSAQTLDTVLDRAGEYVVRYQRDLAGIVAEEMYEQKVIPDLRVRRRPTLPVLRERRLKSDLLLVRPVGAARWLEFRDVFEVDGTPVRDRTDRLEQLFLKPPDNAAAQARAIVTESSRYNIGSTYRTINVPLLALTVLDPANRSRFRFRHVGARRDNTPPAPPKVPAGLPSSPRFAVSTEVWTIEYRETRSDTIIKTTEFRDLPSRGRVWIDPADGRVLMTELIVENRMVRGKMAVSYQSEPLVGLLVPVEMHDEFATRVDGLQTDGTATYGRFRRFTVTVDERFAPIEKN